MLAVLRLQLDVGGLDHQLAAGGHRIARVVREINDDLFDLRGIGMDAAQSGSGQHQQFDGFPQQALQHGLHAGEHQVKIQNARLGRRAAAEGQQVARKSGRPLAGIDDLVDVLA